MCSDTWDALMAGCLIGSLPVVIVYNFFIERFISGLILGGGEGIEKIRRSPAIPFYFTDWILALGMLQKPGGN